MTLVGSGRWKDFIGTISWRMMSWLYGRENRSKDGLLGYVISAAKWLGGGFFDNSKGTKIGDIRASCMSIL